MQIGGLGVDMTFYIFVDVHNASRVTIVGSANIHIAAWISRITAIRIQYTSGRSGIDFQAQYAPPNTANGYIHSKVSVIRSGALSDISQGSATTGTHTAAATHAAQRGAFIFEI